MTSSEMLPPPTPDPQRPAPPDLSQEDDGIVSAVIPYRNTPALIGYYLGVFGLIPCLGLPLSIAAIPLGIAGIRRYRRDRRVKGIVHAWVALVLGVLATVLWTAAIILMVRASRAS